MLGQCSNDDRSMVYSTGVTMVANWKQAKRIIYNIKLWTKSFFIYCRVKMCLPHQPECQFNTVKFTSWLCWWSVDVHVHVCSSESDVYICVSYYSGGVIPAAQCMSSMFKSYSGWNKAIWLEHWIQATWYNYGYQYTCTLGSCSLQSQVNRSILAAQRMV